ncbi:MAG: MBL fold metallo-hydrolase [Chitinophagaceae bacterium]|nr:MAG: MBL fold metallo-hydrolase [Chitinophagaceae bacterium]
MKKQWRPIPGSDHYRNQRFVNLKETPMMAEGVSMWKIMKQMMARPKLVRPAHPLPFVKRDLKQPVSGAPVITWFGHSSYLIQSNGFNILVDPVFSGYAAPVRGMVKAFEGSNEYKPSDFPEIDLLIITHNHYDHLDSDTLRRIAPKTKQFLTGLGVGKDIAACSNVQSPIAELDWWESFNASPGVDLVSTPARHFSGRGLVRGGSLWSSFVLDLHGHRIFLGGDSGYDDFFKTIGERFGPFDLAILECGQYDRYWPDIHMTPEQTALAATELGAKKLLPVHWAKFTLANHLWDDPIRRVVAAAGELQLEVLTPRIGEAMPLDGSFVSQPWWDLG